MDESFFDPPIKQALVVFYPEHPFVIVHSRTPTTKGIDIFFFSACLGPYLPHSLSGFWWEI
jgi:hypothetical protein